MTQIEIPSRDALRLQLAAIGGSEPRSSYLEIRSKRRVGMDQQFVPLCEIDRAMRMILNRSQLTDVYVGAAPRVRQDGTARAIERVWCLWADADSPEAAAALRRFRPLPSIVLRSGTGENLHAWWSLREPLAPAMAARANRRLTLALGADRAATDAARIMRPCGSRNHKHTPPVPVVCLRLECQPFTAGEIVKGLADDPAYAPRPARILPPSAANGNALGGLVRVVREAQPAERNTKLNWAAYRAGEHVANRTVDPAEAEAELLDAALAVGLPEPEARRTIASGLTAATGTVAA